jgi:hypothetical protein
VVAVYFVLSLFMTSAVILAVARDVWIRGTVRKSRRRWTEIEGIERLVNGLLDDRLKQTMTSSIPEVPSVSEPTKSSQEIPKASANGSVWLTRVGDDILLSVAGAENRIMFTTDLTRTSGRIPLTTYIEYADPVTLDGMLEMIHVIAKGDRGVLTFLDRPPKKNSSSGTTKG